VRDRELTILKIIGKYPEIHHRELLRIIEDKGKMASVTAGKTIKNLVIKKKIFAYKYGKEIQYVLFDGELSEKDLKKKASETLKKLKQEIDIIDKGFDGFDYFVKRNLPDYLVQLLADLLETKSNLLKRAKETKSTDMSYAREIFNEIEDLSHTSISNTLKEKKYEHALETFGRIDKMQKEHFRLQEKRSKMGSSNKRDAVTLKLEKLSTDIAKSYDNLESIRDELKSM